MGNPEADPTAPGRAHLTRSDHPTIRSAGARPPEDPSRAAVRHFQSTPLADSRGCVLSQNREHSAAALPSFSRTLTCHRAAGRGAYRSFAPICRDRVTVVRETRAVDYAR